VLQVIWKDFLDIVREEEGSQVVETWLKAVVFEQWDSLGKTAHIKAPNSFVKDWINSNYHNLFDLHLGRLLNVDQITVSFFVGKSSAPLEPVLLEKKKVVEVKGKAAVVVPGKLPVVSNRGIQQSRRVQSSINVNYTFDNFIVGPSNSLAHAAALAVADNPGHLYNPLFMYGSSGLGKTHLLHSIGNHIKINSPSKIIVYQTADRFVNEFISAIRFNRMFSFREKYKLVDVLLIDDIQFIANKDQTQEAFFHIFNSLYESHKQIVFSSDDYPKDLKGITERLRSRMEWGLVTDVYVPTIETKVAILKEKAEQNKESISDEVAYFIASQANSNVRQLEGALVRVIAFAHLTGQVVSKSLAERVLGSIINSTDNTLTFNKIVRAVTSVYSYSLDQLRSKGRGKELVFVRQLIMYFMKKLTDKSLREIGSFLNRKDHSTVLHAVNKISKMIESDTRLHKSIDAIKKELGI
jgi:chromosomal replication initiator protein